MQFIDLSSQSPWIDEVYDLIQQNKIESAVILLTDKICTLILELNFRDLNYVIEFFNLEKLDSSAIHCVLLNTASYRFLLPSRKLFLNKVISKYRKHPEKLQEMLVGLE